MSDYKVSNITLKSITTHADCFSNDDPYINLNGQRFEVLNTSRNVLKDMQSQETGVVQIPGSVGFNTFSDIQLMDEDSGPLPLFFGLPFFDADDQIGRVAYSSTGNEKFNSPIHFKNISLANGDSAYQISYDITRTGGRSPVVLVPRKGGTSRGRSQSGILIGQDGKDHLNAGAGNDVALGGANNDILNGGVGDDVLFGGKGFDTLIGGKGKDTFVVASKTGMDKIKDFRDGDVIGLGSGLKFLDITAVQQASGVLLKAGNESLAFLQGVQPGQLAANDFISVDLAKLNGMASAKPVLQIAEIQASDFSKINDCDRFANHSDRKPRRKLLIKAIALDEVGRLKATEYDINVL